MSESSPTVYEEIEAFAELQFSIDEVALLVERDDDFLLTSEAQRCFLRGRLKAQAAVRKSIKQMAANGVNSAQKLFQDLADKSEPIYEEDSKDGDGEESDGKEEN